MLNLAIFRLLRSIVLSSFFFISSPATAQLIPDNTLGSESSRVVPLSPNRDNIEGGATRGTNLFHSFREFNVNLGREVYFNNPTGVENIINRVTGGNISNIFGTLGVNGNANLYLINPNGIVFGNGAKLDINGTFIGTTADGIRLGTKDVYSATAPASSSLLTIRPEVLFTNRLKAAQKRIITNQGNLKVNPGANLTLSADAINNFGSIDVSGGNIFLEAVNGDINTGNINTSNAINGGGNITISASDNITVEGIIDASGGDLALDDSFFGFLGLSDFIPEQIPRSGNISLSANKNINLNSNFRVFANGSIGGNINIESQNNLRANNGFISSISVGNITGKGGDIRLKGKSIELNQTTLNNTSFQSSELIDSNEVVGADTGNLTIDTNDFRLVNGGFIVIYTGLGRNSGNLNITADRIEIIGSNPDILNGFPSGLLTFIFGTGDGGNITINTDSLRLIDGAEIASLTDGNGGNIVIEAKNIQLSGIDPINNRSSSLSGTFGQKNGGNITINTDSLRLLDGGTIVIRSSNEENSGNLNISAKTIELIGTNSFNNLSSGIFSNGSLDFTDGTITNPGNINIDTKQLKILDGATIESSNLFDFTDNGNSAPISELLDILGLTINSIGENGSIAIKAEEILLNQGRITASGNRLGGGDIKIDSSKFIRLQNNSEISTNVEGASENTGGNLTINSPIIIGLPTNNLINATAKTSAGGNINISTTVLLGYPQFLTIDATSEIGIDGTVNIEDLSDEITRGSLLTLPAALDAEAIMANDLCAVKDGEIAHGSSFTIIGKGAIRSNPLEYVDRTRSGIVEWSDRPPGQTKISQSTKVTPQPPQSKPLQPAVGWYRRTDGTVVLTANPAEVRPLNQPVDYTSGCQKG